MDKDCTRNAEETNPAGGYRTAGFWAAAPELLAACRRALSWFRRARRGSLGQMEEALGQEAPIEALSEAVRRAGRRPPDPVHACSGCGKVFPREEPLHPVEHFWERVEAGDIVPSGQCPECEGLCYLAAPRQADPPEEDTQTFPEPECHGNGTTLVYHRDGLPDPLQSEEEIASGWPDRYRPVARVEADRPEAAFWKTNTTERPWWEKPGVTALAETPIRSTSAGDVVVTGDGPRLCCRIGWKKIERLLSDEGTEDRT
ncbi:MAG: hypothetical protein ACOC7S_01705 [Planctomycetota bacterium]